MPVSSLKMWIPTPEKDCLYIETTGPKYKLLGGLVNVSRQADIQRPK